MSLYEEFIQLLPIEIEKHRDDLLILREFLISYKNNGMDKESMSKALEELISKTDSEQTEDILRDLSDFITGWCGNPSLRIF